MSASSPPPAITMTTTTTTTPPTAEARREAARQLLPTCQRCRRLRRKCDTELPYCRPCAKASAECTFHDHVLGHVLPRAYVASLLKRIEDLQTVRDSHRHHSVAPQRLEPHSELPPASLAQSRANRETDGEESFDLIIPSTGTAGKSRYWGSSSAFVLHVELLQHAVSKGLITGQEVGGDDQPTDLPSARTDEDGADGNRGPTGGAFCLASDTYIAALVQSYMQSVDMLYGFVDHDETDVELRVCLAIRHRPGFSPRALRGHEAHCYFRIAIMCAIACACQARHQPRKTADCFAFYHDAIECVEEVTSEATPDSLRALLHLIVFCLFQPRQGDIWKLLDYACRLTVELGYHTEPQHEESQSPTTNSGRSSAAARAKLRRSTFWGLYAIERIVGQLFGRASDLPESIVTAEYPSASPMPGTNGSIASTVSPGDLGGSRRQSTTPVDQMTFQSMSIPHHYRLVYLRSEIFREMYLPAKPPPNLDLDWLRGKYDMLYAWRQELAVSDDHEGVATLTCDVGFDATMCFLFQPLLLKALRQTATATTCHHVPTVASDPFFSAANLIRTYDKIISAPEHSRRGAYPMTFMSAHYIYLATSTLLAYSLLGLDGRTRILRPMSMSQIDANTATDGGEHLQELDWSEFIDVSGSCLVLLAWCRERWPGFSDTLHVYRHLLGSVNRELLRGGRQG